MLGTMDIKSGLSTRHKTYLIFKPKKKKNGHAWGKNT